MFSVSQNLEIEIAEKGDRERIETKRSFLIDLEYQKSWIYFYAAVTAADSIG
jgi:hypothetical protein